jgi:hypothetical protein
LIDINDDGSLQYYEWKSFRELFITNFEGCDKDKNHLLNADEFKACLGNETVFGNTTKYNDQLAPDKDPFTSQLMKSLDFKQNQSLNFYEYLILRRTSYSYGKCAQQDGDFTFKNFPIATHLALKRVYICFNKVQAFPFSD